VRPTPTLAPADRVEIYSAMYVARLVDALREDFPKLAGALGDAAFADVARAYVARHPSCDPSIRHVGTTFAEFVETEHPGWFGDLARLEWAHRDVFDAPDTAPLLAADLRDVPAEDWPELRFAVVPAFARLVTRWPVHRLWSGGVPPLPETPLPEAR